MLRVEKFKVQGSKVQKFKGSKVQGSLLLSSMATKQHPPTDSFTAFRKTAAIEHRQFFSINNSKLIIHNS